MAMIFTTLPHEGIDCLPPETIVTSLPKGMLRYQDELNKHGFRQRVLVTLLGVDPELPTVVFGVTAQGAQPNVTAVNTRNIWHTSVAVVEHINRYYFELDFNFSYH
jgi:hypothetical protein